MHSSLQKSRLYPQRWLVIHTGRLVIHNEESGAVGQVRADSLDIGLELILEL